MALVWGINSKFPCPICLVPGDQLTNLSETFPLRTTQNMKKICETAKSLNASEGEKLLKEYGLRGVEVNGSSLMN
jgi:hypothetical protein